MSQAVGSWADEEQWDGMAAVDGCCAFYARHFAAVSWPLLATNHDNKFQFYLVSEAGKHPCHRHRQPKRGGCDGNRREVKGIEAPFSQIKAAEPLHLLGKKKGLCFNYLDQRFSSVL